MPACINAQPQQFDIQSTQLFQLGTALQWSLDMHWCLLTECTACSCRL